jgi:hypothetical protein
VDAKHIDGVDDYGFGICFGKKDVNNFYVFYISAGGYFYLARVENSTMVSYKRMDGKRMLCERGINATNYLRYVNDKGKWNFFMLMINWCSVVTHQHFRGKQFGCIIENRQTVDFLKFRFTRIFIS